MCLWAHWPIFISDLHFVDSCLRQTEAQTDLLHITQTECGMCRQKQSVNNQSHLRGGTIRTYYMPVMWLFSHCLISKCPNYVPNVIFVTVSNTRITNLIWHPHLSVDTVLSVSQSSCYDPNLIAFPPSSPCLSHCCTLIQVGFFPSECVELINDKVPQSMTNSVPKPGTPLLLKPFSGSVLEGG